MPTAVSLFSGCGGSDFGLLDAGFEILMANDVLSYAADFYSQNLPSTDFRNCDVAEIQAFPYADLLAGCYPCQGFTRQLQKKSLEAPVQPCTHGVSGPMWHVAQVHHL